MIMDLKRGNSSGGNMKLAFYTGKGGYFNRLIRYWTQSDVTHVELVIDDVWYSSSHTEGGVRAKRINPTPGRWTIIELPSHCNQAFALDVYSSAAGCGYDWTGIIGTHILPLGIQWPRHYFCSELVGAMLGIDKPHRLTPADLYTLYKP